MKWNDPANKAAYNAAIAERGTHFSAAAIAYDERVLCLQKEEPDQEGELVQRAAQRDANMAARTSCETALKAIQDDIALAPKSPQDKKRTEAKKLEGMCLRIKANLRSLQVPS